MEIVHFAPFAPAAAGIYEAARDMVRADSERGHMVSFVDTGQVLTTGEQKAPVTQGVDDRGGFRLVTLPPQWADTADLLVYHTGVNDGWVVKGQAPIVFMIHGRPAACFRPEQWDPAKNGWTLTRQLASWPRTKKCVTFWPEFLPYYRLIVPEEKLVALDWPPIDLARFTPDGDTVQIPAEMKGKVNALICDSWREDVDCFEIAVGAVEAAKRIPGLKVHFYAVETVKGTNQVPACWETIFSALRQRGALGQIVARTGHFDAVYRAMDFVMTPHRIVTRIIGEALATGLPVLAASGCKATRWQAHMELPEHVGQVAERLVDEIMHNRAAVRTECRNTAAKMGLDVFSKAIEPLYQAVSG